MSGDFEGVVRVENLDKVLKRLNNTPKDFGKVVQSSVRAGLNAVKRDISKAAPSRFKKIVKSSAKRSKEGVFSGRAGFFAARREIPDWFKAYWKNYGTLTRRAAGHKFSTPVKSDSSAAARRRRNRTGQRAEQFFDAAVENWQARFLQVLRDSMRKKGYPVK